MRMEITRRYSFEAGHWLPSVPDTHKCKRPHGHNYEFVVRVRHAEGMDFKMGWVLDFWDLDAIVQPLIDKVDHRMLNEIIGLENPTAENIAMWLLTRLAPMDKSQVVSVEVFETKNCSAIVYA